MTRAVLLAAVVAALLAASPVAAPVNHVGSIALGGGEARVLGGEPAG